MRPHAANRKDYSPERVTSTQKKLVPTARPEAAELPPELVEIVVVWPELPEAIRAAIVAMVKAAKRNRRTQAQE
jgi:hypothetical protein